MPFIRGRYHINPVMGEALEAAREVEEALQELQREAENEDAAQAKDARGPVHRVEIEAAEMVRPQEGRGSRGYTVRVHRGPAVTGREDDDPDYGDADAARGAPAAGNAQTHVFGSHGDMLDFLRDELEQDKGRE